MSTAKHGGGVAACLIAMFLCSSVLASTADPVDAQGWRSDVDFVVEKIESIHPRPWHRITEEEFKELARDLKGDIPDLSEEQITVRLMQLVARLGDGHTDLLPLGRPEFADWFPLRFDHFFDGIFITAISTEHEDLLGAEVLHLGSVTAEEAFTRVGSAASVDSRHGWPRSVPPLLSNATILKAMGIVDSDELPLEVRTTDGRQRKLGIPAVSWRVDFGWTRWGFRAPGGVEHVNVYSHLGDSKESLPLHLRHLRDTRFWFEFLPEHEALYMQFNSVSDSPNETLEHFTQRLWDFYETRAGEIDKFVLDLRYNPGGNGYLLRPFIHGFIKHGDINQRGHLYAIVGPGTFSAASNCLGQMIQHTVVIVVGEATSGPLNWCSDTQRLQLPHSGLTLRVSTLCWQTGHPSDTRGYFPPEYPVPVLASDLFAGKDRALETILAGEVRPLADILRNEGGGAFLAEYDQRSAELAAAEGWFPYLEFDLTALGFEMLGSDRLDDAAAVLKLNTILHPESWRTWDDLGDGYMAKGDRELAIQSYARSLELNPDNISVWRRHQQLRFLSSYERGGLEEATQLYRETREENLRAYDEGAMNAIGYSLLREGKKREAIEVFKLNSEAYPESWNVWDSLAEAYMENGDTKRAIQYYERSLELNPANENGREMLRRIRNDD